MKAKSAEERKEAVSVHVLNVIMFALITGMFCLGSIVMPKKGVSEVEKRELASFPSFSVNSFLSGNYFKDIELYYNDNFPFRDKLIEISSSIDDIKGIRKGNEEIKIYK